MITAVAVDDEPLALNIIKAFCNKTDLIQLQEIFTEPKAALAYLADHPVDLLFLDINMPSMSGIEFYKKVPKKTMVVFTTAYSEYAVEGFNLDAVDYLLKPFDFKRFLKSVEKANEYFAFLNKKELAGAAEHLFVRVDYSMVKIVISEILYIEGLDNYVKFHFDNGKTLLVRMSMKAVTDKLPDEDFIRVHRSFTIPFKKITSVRNKTIYLGAQEIPIGTNYVDEIIKLLKESGH